MSKKYSTARLLWIALFVLVSASAFAQDTIYVQAVPFHRFITQNATLGHFLTSDFSQGTGNPYNYASQPFPAQADIVPVVPGYEPRAGQGLMPVHFWQVHESPRIYYYYTIWYGSHGGNYHYQGIAGYALLNSAPGGTPFQYWYSQSYGYYYTLTGEYPPCCTFSYHGTSWKLPVGGTYIFDRIPEPQDPCAGFEEDRSWCELQGRTWNNDLCFCEEPICNPWCQVQ